MRFEVKANQEMGLKAGDKCIFRRDFYCDLGTVVHAGSVIAEEGGGELPTVLHIAEPGELEAAEENEQKNRSAMRTAEELVGNLGLEMKLLNAHYSVDGKMAVFQFTADGRVDFRELVKELSRALDCRIELRQIGVRDEAGIFGGISVCGQVMCCSRFLREFNSINVKMAKEQDLSLTPATISGVCGRLKCCLKFEHEAYLDLAKDMPRKGEWCDTPQGRGKITDRNLLSHRVSVQLESGNIASFDRSDVTVTANAERKNNSNGGSPKGDSKPRRDNSGSNSGGNSGRGQNPRNSREQRNAARENRNGGRADDGENAAGEKE